MDAVDLKAVYDCLKGRYDLVLTNAFSLDAGFSVDCPVLFGQNAKNKFYLYNDGSLAVFDIENREGTASDHWHPGSVREAVEDIIAFMEDTCEFDWVSL